MGPRDGRRPERGKSSAIRRYHAGSVSGSTGSRLNAIAQTRRSPPPNAIAAPTRFRNLGPSETTAARFGSCFVAMSRPGSLGRSRLPSRSWPDREETATARRRRADRRFSGSPLTMGRLYWTRCSKPPAANPQAPPIPDSTTGGNGPALASCATTAHVTRVNQPSEVVSCCPAARRSIRMRP